MFKKALSRKMFSIGLTKPYQHCPLKSFLRKKSEFDIGTIQAARWLCLDCRWLRFCTYSRMQINRKFNLNKTRTAYGTKHNSKKNLFLHSSRHFRITSNRYIVHRFSGRSGNRNCNHFYKTTNHLQPRFQNRCCWNHKWPKYAHVKSIF